MTRRKRRPLGMDSKVKVSDGSRGKFSNGWGVSFSNNPSRLFETMKTNEKISKTRQPERKEILALLAGAGIGKERRDSKHVG